LKRDPRFPPGNSVIEQLGSEPEPLVRRLVLLCAATPTRHPRDAADSEVEVWAEASAKSHSSVSASSGAKNNHPSGRLLVHLE
jgi:hypothetical protein